jgi:hypothetical protein
MPGLLASQLGLAAVNPVYKESPPRQGAIVQWAVTGGVCCWRCEQAAASRGCGQAGTPVLP